MPHALLLIADGYDEAQTDAIVSGLQRQGYDTTIGGIKAGTDVTGSAGGTRQIQKGYLDFNLGKYDVLVVPGGSHAEALAGHKSMVNVAYSMAHKGRAVATIGGAAKLLIEAANQKTSPNPVATGTHILEGGILEGRAVTGAPDLQEGLEKAGATFVEDDIAVDGPIVTAAADVDPQRFVAAVVPVAQHYRTVLH